MSARKTKDGFPAEASVRINSDKPFDSGRYCAWVNPCEMRWEAWYEDSDGNADTTTATTPCHRTWQNAIAEVRENRRAKNC